MGHAAGARDEDARSRLGGFLAEEEGPPALEHEELHVHGGDVLLHETARLHGDMDDHGLGGGVDDPREGPRVVLDDLSFVDRGLLHSRLT